jgi:hypothetical protein
MEADHVSLSRESAARGLGPSVPPRRRLDRARTNRDPVPGGGSATVTAGDSYVYGLTLLNGTANPISGVTAGILGSTIILLVAGNDKLVIVKDVVVNDKCDLLMLAAGGSCTFGLKIFTEDEALGAGGLTADYTVSPTVFYNDNNSVSVTLKARLVAPVFVPEPGAWMLLIVGSAAVLLAKAKLVTAGFMGRRRWLLPSGPS